MKKFLHLVLNMAVAMSLFTFSTGAAAQIGSLSSDLVFTPVTPCRIMDTRNPGSISGILVAGTTRRFNGNSTTANYPIQGGLLGTCGLPFVTDVAAIVLNFTVVSPAAAGYITVFPDGVAQPLAATVNFTAGSVVGNNATLKISQADTNGSFNIFSTTNTHVVADVVGYYAKPVATALQCETTAVTTAVIKSGPIDGLYFTFATPVACTSGYTEISLHCMVTDARASASANGFPASGCSGNAPVNTLALTTSRTCCRIPGR